MKLKKKFMSHYSLDSSAYYDYQNVSTTTARDHWLDVDLQSSTIVYQDNKHPSTIDCRVVNCSTQMSNCSANISFTTQ